MVNILNRNKFPPSGIKKNYECELCGMKFDKFGPAEDHQRWKCEVGHDVRTAFFKGQIESPLSGKLKMQLAEDKEIEMKKRRSALLERIDKARKSVSSRLLEPISQEKLNAIEEAIEERQFTSAKKLIEDMSKEIKDIVASAKPKLIASIPTELQANIWIRSTITINNEGDAHACNIELSIDGLEVRGSPRIDYLEANTTKEIDIALRTDGAGSIPVTLSLKFKKLNDESSLSAEFSEWIEAGVVPMTASTEATLPKTKTSTKTSTPVEEWKPPEGLDGDLEILAEFFALRRNAYQASPANESLLDELHNRREDFAISSYFEIPTSSADILQEWALPPNIRGNVHLDTLREDIVERVSSAEAKQNFVIIGDPGVGKTVLLFEIMDRLMKKMPVGVITTPALGDAHLTFSTRLFYDDIPENMDLIDAINERQSQGLIVTAREADWQALPESFQGLFNRLTVPLFTKEDMVPLCNKMLEFSGLGYDKAAVKLLVDFAEGSPIYVWSLIRELMHSGIRTLSKTYIQEHATKGMANYVSMLLQRLLKDGKEFRPGGLHALTCMVFLTEYMDERRCHDLYFRTAAEVIAERTEEELNDSLHMVTFNHVMAYLSGEGSIVRFPHDTWVDVLGGAGSLNPFRAEIQTIHSAFEDTGAFNEVMKETVVDTWTTLSSRYRRNSARNRDSFLALADTLLRNFTLADLKELEVDIEFMREIASAHSHLPLAAMLVSKLQTAQPSRAQNVINIQDSVINRSNLV